MRSIHPGVLLVVNLAALAGVGPVFSGDQGQTPPPAGEPRAVLIEKTVYVPYEKLQAIFEKEGRGIFLPYEEFLDLWRKAQPKPPEPPPDVAPAPAVIRAGTYTGAVAGDVVRFSVDYAVESLKKGWVELEMPLRGAAVESVEISSPEAIFNPKGPGYALFLPAPGRYQLKIQFSVRIAQEPGKKTVAFGLPPAGVSRLDLSIPEEGVRVDLKPAIAVTQTTAADKSTKVLAFLGNSSEVSVSWMPPVGKLVEGGAVLLAEQDIRASLGERTLKVSTDVSFQVLRGEVDTLRVRAPEGLRLLSVKGDNIREWTQEKDVVVVKLHSPLKDSSSRPGADAKAEAGAIYRLALSFERILQETPPALQVPFPRVEVVIRESGWVVFSHETGLNVRFQTATGLSQADKDEVPEPLRAGLGTGFRYLAHPIALNLQVETIAPVIRSFTTSVVTLGNEEDVWVGWIDFAITRAGVFRLEIRVPARWSVATLGEGASVEDFQLTDAGEGQRTISVSLKTRALGNFRLPFRLTAQGSAAAGEATIPPPVILRSEQDRGLLGVSAPKAINLTTVSREKMTSADVDELFRSGIMGQVGADVGMPMTYSYREQPASVKVRLEAKKTEINLLAQHLVEISDGGIKLTHILDYEILYAATDRLSFIAPSSLDALKVEAKEKKEERKGASAEGRTEWEVILQAPVLGLVTVTVSHEMELKALEPGKPFPYVVPLVGSKSPRKNGFVALRKEGNLEIVPQQSGMEPIDAGDLPDKLRRGQIYSAFRYFTPEPTLSLTLTRYEYQVLASTIVNLIHAKGILSEDRKLKSQAVLLVQNTERQYLELKLPQDSSIISLSVAGKPQQPRKRRDGTGTLVQIPPSAGPRGTFPVVIEYEETLAKGDLGSMGSARLSTLEVLENVPVTKIEMALFLPPDYVYLGWGGNLKLAAVPGAPNQWTRFKNYLAGLFGIGAAPAGQQPQEQQAPEPPAVGVTLDMDRLSRDYIRHDFETLAPVGSLSFSYVGKTLYGFLDFLAFALWVAAGILLVAKVRWGKLATAAAFTFLPLVLVWFSEGPIVEIFTSFLVGGIVLCLVFAVPAVAKKAAALRSVRLSKSPDPYLEEAAAPAMKKDLAPPPAAGPAGAEGNAAEGPGAEKK